VSGSEKDVFEIRVGRLRSCCLACTNIRFWGFFCHLSFIVKLVRRTMSVFP